MTNNLLSSALLVRPKHQRHHQSLGPQHRPSLVSCQAVKKTSTATTATSRQNRVQSLNKWAESVQIQMAKNLLLQSTEQAGLGWWAGSGASASAGASGADSDAALQKGQVVLQVPADLVLSVEEPGDGPNDIEVRKLLRTVTEGGKNDQNKKDKEALPWFVQLSVYLYKLDRMDGSSTNNKYRPWLDSLPRKFDTLIHWSDSNRQELQYPYMVQQVERQEQTWRKYYQELVAASDSSSNPLQAAGFTWDDFVWGCECARSRAFSGAYTGQAFNPGIYAFTLLLVSAYVGLGLGDLEQAANGAGVVVSVSILRDFVVPKLFKKKRYVIAPVIDMANHQSVGATADVSFEYFANAYSLACTTTVPAGEQVYISYGSRSNDQLLQYYGFVEKDNPNDVYIMPPLREWNIAALEGATGRQFAAGRLQKLDRAGLLGGTVPVTAKDSDNDGDDKSSPSSGQQGGEQAANLDGGVVLTAVTGVDPAVLQALRALVSTEQEWEASGEAVGNFSEDMSGGAENERCARLAAQTAIEMELASMPTSIQEDEELLKRMNTMKSLDAGVEEKLAIEFRIEKKKLLLATIAKL
jgi:hypothetical protein